MLFFSELGLGWAHVACTNYTNYALISDLGLGWAHVASDHHLDFVEIVCEAGEKDSDGEPFSNLDGAEVDGLEANMKKNNNS